MKKHVFMTRLMVVAVLFILSSCMDKGHIYEEPTPPSKGDYFGYSTTQKVSVNINYGFKDYVILFGLYDENPLEAQADGSFAVKEIEPVFRASTDGNGCYTGEIVLPAYISELWLYSDYLGTISPVQLQIENGGVAFDQEKFTTLAVMKSRALTTSGHSYPEGFLTLGDWNENGRPEYLLQEKALPPASVLYSIKEVFSKVSGHKIPEKHPEFLDGNMISDIVIQKPTKVNLSFLGSGANWKNTVGYYTYKTGEQPDLSKIQKIIAFPCSSPFYINNKKEGALFCGEQVQLKYWDGTQFQDEFPEGVTIGWFLCGMGYKDGNIINQHNRYSTKNLNTDSKQRVVSLRDPGSNQIVAIGFEDNEDFDYGDAIFYVNIETKGAMDTTFVPVLPPADKPGTEDNYTVYTGTLTFEDQWPSQGDYDMNDVMIEYNCKVYRTIVDNKVVKTVDEFTPIHNGGLFQNGFGYELPNVTSDMISSVKIEGPVTSQYMKGKKWEEGQSYATIILFDNQREVIGEKFVVTIECNEISITPPYNPFIIAKSNEGRGREVHLVNFKPTDLADTDLMTTGTNVYNPLEGLYYIAQDNMPFAIHMPNITNLPVPEETVRIDVTYPEFPKWVKSNGKEARDWYKHPVAN